MKNCRFACIVAVLSLIGAVLSYLNIRHFVELRTGILTGPSFCNINATFNCDLVSQSEWSAIFGIPIASYGFAFYAGLLLLALTALDKKLFTHKSFVETVSGLSVLAAIFSVYLFYISEFVIGTLCLMCIGMYFVNFILLLAAFLQKNGNSFSSQVKKGLLNIFKVPILVFGANSSLTSSQRAVVRTGVLVALFVLGIAYSLPDFIAMRLMLNRNGPGELLSESSLAVRAWSRQARDDFNLSFENSLLTDDFYKGNKDSPIEIIEFSDFECPACKHLYQGMEEVLREYEGKYILIHKNFPLDRSCNAAMKNDIHENACYAAYFARCAAEQNKFWEAVDYLFSADIFKHGKANELVRADIEKGSDQIGIDKSAVQECISSNRHKTKIISDIQEGEKLQISGTPSLWINRKRVETKTKPVIKAIIDEVLSSK